MINKGFADLEFTLLKDITIQRKYFQLEHSGCTKILYEPEPQCSGMETLTAQLAVPELLRKAIVITSSSSTESNEAKINYLSCDH
jgi:hypothetical protein